MRALSQSPGLSLFVFAKANGGSWLCLALLGFAFWFALVCGAARGLVFSLVLVGVGEGGRWWQKKEFQEVAIRKGKTNINKQALQEFSSLCGMLRYAHVLTPLFEKTYNSWSSKCPRCKHTKITHVGDMTNDE